LPWVRDFQDQKHYRKLMDATLKVAHLAIDAQNMVSDAITDSCFNAFLVHEVIFGETQNVQVSDNYFAAIT